jgi:hypothetical protein
MRSDGWGKRDHNVGSDMGTVPDIRNCRQAYGTSTPEQTSTFSPAYPKCFLPKGGHRSDGHGANVDYDAEMSDRCCVFWRAYSDFALVLNIITYV